MMISPAATRTRSVLDEQKIPVSDLIRRVEALMSDERYPPIHNLRVIPAASS